MHGNLVILSLVYSVTLGLSLSLAASYVWRLLKTYTFSEEAHLSQQARLRRVCHQVEACRRCRSARGVIRAGVSVLVHTEQIYIYSYKGKDYKYTYFGEDDKGDCVTLYFLSNPATACVAEELVKWECPSYVVLAPLTVLLSVVIYRYVYHWLSAINIC